MRYRTNDYSVPVAYGHQDVWIRGYVDEVVFGCGGETIARHPRRYEREEVVFDTIPQKNNSVPPMDNGQPDNDDRFPQSRNAIPPRDTAFSPWRISFPLNDNPIPVSGNAFPLGDNANSLITTTDTAKRMLRPRTAHEIK